MTGLPPRSLVGSGFFLYGGKTSAQPHPYSIRGDSRTSRRAMPSEAGSQMEGRAHRQRLGVRSGRKSGRRYDPPADKRQTRPAPALLSRRPQPVVWRYDSTRPLAPTKTGRLAPRYRTGRDSRPLPQATGPAPTVASPAPASSARAMRNPGRYTAGSSGQPQAMRRGSARRPGDFSARGDQDQERGVGVPVGGAAR